MIKVSIIVPIFNAEKYLHKCIQSLQQQTLKDIEIILVNDGSIDNSLSICYNYAISDERIIVLNKKNGGVSSARNLGLEYATGEYIGFVDPDDWIENNMYESMISKINYSEDIVMCNYIIENENSSHSVSINVPTNKLNQKEIKRFIISKLISRDSLSSDGEFIMGSVWRLLIKRHLIQRNNLLFKEDIPLMEDLIFCIEALTKCSSLIVDSKSLYHYCTNYQSAMQIYRTDMYDLQKKVYKKIEEIMKSEEEYIDFLDRMNIRYINLHISSIVNETHKCCNKKVRDKIKYIGTILGDQKLQQALNEVNYRDCSFFKKMVLSAMRFKWSFYLYFYYSTIGFLKALKDYLVRYSIV